jgi:putative SOS response-associated peptidase YedK
MPVILDPAHYDKWLDPDAPTEELRALFKPFPDALMRMVPVNRAVNNVRNDTEACIEPVSLEGAG